MERALRIVGFVLALCVAPLLTTSQETGSAVRFTWVDLWIDAGEHELAAWQLDLALERAGAVLVGVEGGAHPAYAEPAHYDPEALRASERVILAALAQTDAPPSGRTRVARLHYQVSGSEQLALEALRVVAGDARGNEIEVAFEAVEGEQ